jgi:hypothetical protein
VTERYRAAAFGPCALVERWQVFWFRPEPTYPLGLIRIAFGVLTVGWGLSLLPDMYALFGRDGIAPHQPADGCAWGIFEIWTGDRALLIGCILLVAAGIAMTVGWHARLAALIVFVLTLSFQYRDPAIFNSGDNLMRIEALIIALSPCGTALSLDQRRRLGAFWSAQLRAPWTLRLLQLQLSVVYLAAIQAKMSGHAWPEGTAVSYALRLDDMLLLRTPHWLTANALLMNIATWGTLAVELAIGILVWNRRLRPWVLAAGVVMHTAIMLNINVGFFTPAMLVLYLAFVSPQTVQQLPTNIARLGGRIAVLAHRRNPDPGLANPINPTEAMADARNTPTASPLAPSSPRQRTPPVHSNSTSW